MQLMFANAPGSARLDGLHRGGRGAFTLPAGRPAVGAISSKQLPSSGESSTRVSWRRIRPGAAHLMAKKGKPAMPLRPAAPELPEDGSPVFAIVVKSPVSGIWYPLVSMKGDNRAKMLVTAMRTQWGRRLYADTLNKGVARSVFSENGKRAVRRALQRYPQLRKHSYDALQFGFRTMAKGFDYPTQEITPELAMNFFQWAFMKLTGGKPPSLAEKSNKQGSDSDNTKR
ncbi:hypothetical protein CDCA_CDCA08G2477 [Cyanidium caldarium]|uniref:Uncharacterized protein n=1 Tax=Cyanidium caldarium TaxID=2771 RepID=A0AAV9IW17_CYACA|nr:hypothetical protein CDCA_CDCA08G2477 [Cyanidium caldarium]